MGDTRRTAASLAGLFVLAGCAGGGRLESGLPRQVSAAQRLLALDHMNAAQRRAALRAPLPAGTKIYGIETVTFAVGADLFVVPSSQIVSIDGSNATYQDAAGTRHELHGARVVVRDQSQEAIVKPGRPLPAFLAGRVPDEVIR
jgi:hypothetical protein